MLRKILPWHRFYKGEEPNLALDIRYALHQDNSRESSALSSLFCMGMFLEHGPVRKTEGDSKWHYLHLVPWELAGNSCLLTAENRDNFSGDSLSQTCMFATISLGCWRTLMPPICSQRRGQFFWNPGPPEPWLPKQNRSWCSPLGPQLIKSTLNLSCSFQAAWSSEFKSPLQPCPSTHSWTWRLLAGPEAGKAGTEADLSLCS